MNTKGCLIAMNLLSSKQMIDSLQKGKDCKSLCFVKDTSLCGGGCGGGIASARHVGEHYTGRSSWPVGVLPGMGG